MTDQELAYRIQSNIEDLVEALHEELIRKPDKINWSEVADLSNYIAEYAEQIHTIAELVRMKMDK